MYNKFSFIHKSKSLAADVITVNWTSDKLKFVWLLKNNLFGLKVNNLAYQFYSFYLIYTLLFLNHFCLKGLSYESLIEYMKFQK